MTSRIGKYTIERELGHGGFGRVYLGFDPDVGRQVAIKVLLAEGDPEKFRRFQVEIATTGNLRHKNIVTIYASGDEGGNPYLVMELLEGQTLKDVIQLQRPLSLLEKVRIMTQVAEGLAYAHSKGVVHRDVKPENIMLLPDLTVKIMDFGIALAANRLTTMTQAGYMVGTERYMAPEQFTVYDVKANEQTDIFSYGDVYYELLTGKHPFVQIAREYSVRLDVALTAYEPPPVSQLVAGIPEALETLVHRSLSKDPAFRYKKFSDLALYGQEIMADLQHELAAQTLRDVPRYIAAADFEGAMSKILEVLQLEPGNREARRLRDQVDQQIDRKHNQVRVSELIEEAEQRLRERRFPEAVQCLDTAVKLDTTNETARIKLDEARRRLDSFVRANRLIEEGRSREEQGQLVEALERLKAALDLDTGHLEADRLVRRVSEKLAHRTRELRKQETLRLAATQIAEKRFTEALSTLEACEREQPGIPEIAELRGKIERERTEEERRRRAERYQLALSRTREAMQAGELERAGQMLDHLYANFAQEPGAAELLPQLRERLSSLRSAQQIAEIRQQAQDLLNRDALPEALEILAKGLREFPNETGLLRLNRSTTELYESRRRTEQAAQVIEEAKRLRAAGRLPEALASITAGRKRLGEDAALVDFGRRLELEIEQRRYATGLEELLRSGRELMSARRFHDAAERLAAAKEYGGEADVRTLLESARSEAAIEEEKRLVSETMDAVRNLEAAGNPELALSLVRESFVRYPHNSELSRAADRLLDLVEKQRHRKAVEATRAKIQQEIGGRNWTRAEKMLRDARLEFPGESAFDDLTKEVEERIYQTRLDEVEKKVRQRLEANEVEGAVQEIEATRGSFARDRRWTELASEVEQRRTYESALKAAEQQRREGNLDRAEELLTGHIQTRVADARATQMFQAIQTERVELRRRKEMRELEDSVRRRLTEGRLDDAASELSLARSRYPGEPQWGTLQNEIDSRQTAIRRKDEIAATAAGIRMRLERNELQTAGSELTAARRKYPQETSWAALQQDLDGRLERQRAMAAAEEEVRQILNRGDVQRAEEALWSARGRFPEARGWGALEDEIRLVRSQLERQAEIESEARRVHSILREGDLHRAAAELDAARRRFGGDDPWSTLQRAIEERRAEQQREAEMAARAEAIERAIERAQVELARENPAEATGTLRRVEQQFPGDARVHELLRTSEEQLRGRERRDAIERGLSEAESLAGGARFAEAIAVLQRLDAQHPGDARVSDGLRYCQQQLQEREREAAIERSLEVARRLMEQGRIPEASNALRQVDGRYPGDSRVAQLLRTCEEEWREHERRSTQEKALARLETIEREIVGAPARRLRAFHTEVAAIQDAELRPRAAAVLSRIDAALAAAPPRKPIPWRLVGIAATAAALTLSAIIFLPRAGKEKPPVLLPLEIRTDPPGAAVKLGDRTCVSPACRFDLAPGNYKVEATLKGFEPASQDVTLSAAAGPGNVNLTLKPVAVPPPPPPGTRQGTLVVRTGLPDALVSVDGAVQGRTDSRGTLSLTLEARAHEIRAEKERYHAATRQVEVGANDSKAVELALTPKDAHLELVGAPAGAEVRTPSKFLARATAGRLLTVAVAPGAQNLVLVDGTATRQFSRAFQPDETVRLNWKDVGPVKGGGTTTPPVTVTPEEIENREWNQVKDSSDPAALRAFLRAHAAGAHRQDALNRIEALSWSGLNKEDAGALNGYLREFPSGPHASEAQSRLGELAWKGVDQKNADALRRFVAASPGNSHVGEARRIIDQLDKQRLAEEQQRAQAKTREREAAMADIRKTLVEFNTAYARGRQNDLKAVWPGVEQSYLQAMSYGKIEVRQSGDPTFEGDKASIPCEMLTTTRQPNRTVSSRVVVSFQNMGGRWLVSGIQRAPN